MRRDERVIRLQELSDQARTDLGPIRVLVHNASSIHIAPFLDTTPEQFEDLWRVTCLGAVNSARAVLPDMLAQNPGVMIFTGATAALRGGARFSAFAAAKFALRGLAQSLAREHAPNGIHVAHVIVDGLIWAEKARDRFDAKEEIVSTLMLSPISILGSLNRIDPLGHKNLISGRIRNPFSDSRKSRLSSAVNIEC